ncbi:MAG TPA: hypothetical protein DDZ91_06895 [Firmicutes bacterium]|jgi:hypothetical protein|nr:hypothetical protein [Bacillota bacterium]
MIGPLNVQVLVNRTLDVQKQQGHSLNVIEDENKILKNRLDNQIKKEEQQVRRKSETVQGRVQDDHSRKEERDSQHQGKNFSGEQPSKKDGKQTDWKGRFIDMEL